MYVPSLDVTPSDTASRGPRAPVTIYFYQFWLIQLLWSFLKKGYLTTVIHYLIVSKLDYYNSVSDLPLKSVQKLQLVQKAVPHFMVSGSRVKRARNTCAERQIYVGSLFTSGQNAKCYFKAQIGLGSGCLKEYLFT